MGRRGPAPHPTALRVLHGDRPYRINSREPKPRAGVPEPPTWMPKKALPFWTKILRDAAPGVVTTADGDALAILACQTMRLAEAERAIEIAGNMLKDDKDKLIPNPAVRIARDAALIVGRLQREFGLTPSARVSLQTPSPRGSDLDALLS